MRPSLRRQLLQRTIDLSALAANPENLCHAYASWFAEAGGHPHWLHQRVHHTHDLWHVVCGCPHTALCEAACSTGVILPPG